MRRPSSRLIVLFVSAPVLVLMASAVAVARPQPRRVAPINPGVMGPADGPTAPKRDVRTRFGVCIYSTKFPSVCGNREWSSRRKVDRPFPDPVLAPLVEERDTSGKELGQQRQRARSAPDWPLDREAEVALPGLMLPRLDDPKPVPEAPPAAK